MTIAKLEKHLLTFADSISKELTISEKSKAEFPDLYHISIDAGIKKFIPRISNYQLDGEDRSVPRVVGSSSLLGCILAYAHVQKDYLQEPEKLGKENVGKHFEWNNGYYVYQLDYDYALKPTDKLVPMATQTDETWLISHSSDHTEYEPRRIAKFFVKEFRFTIKDGSEHEVETTVLLEVSEETGLQFSKNKRLTKGFWLIEMSDVGAEAWKTRSWAEDQEIKITEISKDTWLASKNAIANMLNYDDTALVKAPSYARW
jgi:hypothetical protein